MKINFFVGIDLAFSKMGWCILDKGNNVIKEGVFSTSNKDSDEIRLIEIRNFFSETFTRDSIIYMEGLAYQSKGQTKAQLDASHYILRVYMYENQYTYKIIPPTSLKKFITGKGQCQKNLMLLKVYKKFGVEYSDDNLADAYSLARMSKEENLDIIEK